jgi:cytochrome o ubiquinol oxidase operon protein cyoD
MTKAQKSTRAPLGSFASYTVGFVLSVALTLGSFWLAPHLGGFATGAITIAAIVQLFVQLIFFLHMGREKGSEWNIIIFVFALVIIGILIGGTLWIMSNLARPHTPTPSGTDLYEDGVIAPQNELH